MSDQTTNTTGGTTTSGFVQTVPQQPQPCPHCGHCPTCGRGGYYAYPWYPSVYPIWYQTTMTGGTGSMPVIDKFKQTWSGDWS